MVIGLIGMSCTGKTYWAERLKQAGFACVHCDDAILARAGAWLGRPPLAPSELGAWLGMPDQPGYAERERALIACEAEVMREVLERVEGGYGAGGPLVVDTGGSAIYIGAELLARMRRLMTLVYLTVPQEVYQEMLRDYIACPRSLIWSGAFERRPGESRLAAFERSYAALIEQRARRYAALCDVQIDYAFHRHPDATVEGFLAHLPEPVRRHSYNVQRTT